MDGAGYSSEEKLLAALRNGKDDALKHVYVQYWPMIARFVQLNSGRKDDAEELFQEAIIAFYEKLRDEQFVLTCSVKTYIYSICRNKWLTQLRERNKIQDVGEYIHTLPEPTEDEHEFPEDARIQEAIRQLGEPCHSLLVGFYYQKRSMEQLAAQMSYASANVAKQQKFRCLEQLKKVFT